MARVYAQGAVMAVSLVPVKLALGVKIEVWTYYVSVVSAEYVVLDVIPVVDESAWVVAGDVNLFVTEAIVQVAAMVVHIILDDGTSYTMQEDKADQHVEILLQLSFEKTPISTSVDINQS